jgi:F-type H+-transporting ATPase subunit epsilon
VNLTIYLPTEVFLDTQVKKVVAESPAGCFCLLPRHIDYATALVACILSYLSAADEEKFLAVESGILVKQGDKILICAHKAISGSLGKLKPEIEKISAIADTKEKKTRSAVARLEADFIRRFVEFGKHG